MKECRLPVHYKYPLQGVSLSRLERDSPLWCLICSTEVQAEASSADTASCSDPGISATDAESLCFHEVEGTLLHRIQGIAQGILTIHRVSEIITHIRIDLVHGWPPDEVFIHLCGTLREHLVDHLIAIERLWAVNRGRA